MLLNFPMIQNLWSDYGAGMRKNISAISNALFI